MICIFTISGTCLCESNEPCKARIAIDILEQQLQLAHKEGWEQCHKEATELGMVLGNTYRYGVNVSGHEVANAIAAMEYKE